MSEIGESDLSELSSAPNSPFKRACRKIKALREKSLLFQDLPFGNVPPVGGPALLCQRDTSGNTPGSAGTTRLSPAVFGLDAVTSKALGFLGRGAIAPKARGTHQGLQGPVASRRVAELSTRQEAERAFIPTGIEGLCRDLSRCHSSRGTGTAV